MQYDHILIRYGEISLKNKNRNVFTDQLKKNVIKVLSEFSQVWVKKSRSRMVIVLNGEAPDPIMDKLEHVFGIHSLSLAIRTNSEVEDIKRGALAAIKDAGQIGTFKVTVKRADKKFPINSQEMNHVVGGHVLQNTDSIKVDVHNPDINLRVEIREAATYITCSERKGPGGLPVGTGGKVMLMLSGGIDSPVAAYLLMKRGVEVEAIHFHSPPFTSERAKQKVEDLTKVLTRFGGTIKLHVVPFTKLQQHLHQQIPDNYTMTAMRRMMLRITEQLARKHNALALGSGESLGQVASQTLESMNAINEVTDYPVLRPLITMDKLEIIEIAKQIGTYDISVLPYEDCCTVFLPASPKTKPKREKINRYESFLEADDLILDAIENTEIIEINEGHNINQLDKEFEDLL